MSEQTFGVRVLVRPRPEILDPQGKAIGQALGRLGFDGVESVRAGKAFELEIRAPDAAAAVARASEMAEKLLANPVTEDFEVAVVEGGS